MVKLTWEIVVVLPTLWISLKLMESNEKFWPEGVHFKKEWIYIGSASNGIIKLDVYKHEFSERYAGISAQYGLEEQEYFSSSCVYIDDPVISFEDGIMKAFAIAHDRCKFRNE